MGRMKMVDQLTIPAHGEARFAPGGYHLMLMQAQHPVQAGESVPITLHFADGSQRPVTFLARPANAIDAGDARHSRPTPAAHPDDGAR